ncbi:response regulator [Pseudomonas sp. 18175]|uniref:response regulator n=1 Tax=Pseudomonas sp. 18175 TaxID=3390056 RepID=UPI003D20A701
MSGGPLRILLVDDHQLFRQGLMALLGQERDMSIVGQAGDGLQALSQIDQQQPELVILDLEMPQLNGLDTLSRARLKSPNLRVLCLSAHGDLRKISQALEAGACGYLLKECACDELLKAVRTVASGRVYLSPDVATAMAVNRHPSQRNGLAGAPLSPREKQILQLLVDGCTTRAIAECMHISSKTVSTHREHIMAKLNLKGIAQLTRYALREGLI